MRTTLDINDALLAKADSVAAKEQTSLTRLIKEALVLRLRPQIGQSDSGRLPLLTAHHRLSGRACFGV